MTATDLTPTGLVRRIARLGPADEARLREALRTARALCLARASDPAETPAERARLADCARVLAAVIGPRRQPQEGRA